MYHGINAFLNNVQYNEETVMHYIKTYKHILNQFAEAQQTEAKLSWQIKELTYLGVC